MKRFILAAALAACLVVGVSVASADHFEPNSSLDCGALIGGNVNCTLTIGVFDIGPGLSADEDVTSTLTGGATGATYVSGALTTGTTCAGAASVAIDSPTVLRVDNPSANNDCYFIVDEVLAATATGEVCQTLNSEFNAPPITVCAQIEPGPQTTADCRDGGWQTYGVFANQGDCVSYVATKGKNPPK